MSDEPKLEELDRLIARRGAGKRARQERPVGEAGLVLAACDLVLGAAVAEIEHHARQPPPRDPPELGDAECLAFQTCPIQGALRCSSLADPS